EPLEDRLALSGVAAADPFMFAGPTGADSPVVGLKWPQAAPGTPVTITYSYANLLDGSLGGGLAPSTIRAPIDEALWRWAAVAPLSFVERPDAGPPTSPDNYDGTGLPMIRFGDRPIDGPYGVLGVGNYPGTAGISGDVQFDSSENWTTDPSK